MKKIAKTLISASILIFVLNMVFGGIIVSANVDGRVSTQSVLFQVDNSVINFPDINLEVTIRNALNKSNGDITIGELATLTKLDGFEKGIADLTNINYCINLTYLDLRDNNIRDISPLASLTKLATLYLRGNQISDISPLSGLTNLTDLTLRKNKISDISPLVGLVNLKSLYLLENQITDITPLLQNPGLGKGDNIELQDNSFSLQEGASAYNVIVALEKRGVSVLPTISIQAISQKQPTVSDDGVFWKIVWSIVVVVLILGLAVRIIGGGQRKRLVPHVYYTEEDDDDD